MATIQMKRAKIIPLRAARREKNLKVASAEKLKGQARKILKHMPDIRLDEVEEIRQAIEKGQYNVSGKKVAKRIVLNAMSEGPWS